MTLLNAIFLDPFAQMISAPDLLVQTIWEGFVAGVLYALIALGFVLIFKASGVFNFAQGIMMVFAALTLVGLHERGVPAWLALIATIGVMYVLALCVERIVLRPLVNQPDIILFMATFGLTYFLIGLGELVFGGNPKTMITEQLYLPSGAFELKILGGVVSLQKIYFFFPARTRKLLGVDKSISFFTSVSRVSSSSTPPCLISLSASLREPLKPSSTSSTDNRFAAPRGIFRTGASSGACRSRNTRWNSLAAFCVASAP